MTTSTTTLAAWLLAQIEHDRRRAASGLDWLQTQSVTWTEAVNYLCPLRVGYLIGAHLDPLDPARVLAECEAKRSMVEIHGRVQVEDWISGRGMATFDVCLECGDPSAASTSGDPAYEVWPCMTLRLLALPYADRPGYQEAWRP